MQLGRIVEALEKACPSGLAAEWDNVGLHVGDVRTEIDAIAVALDADLASIDRAIESGAGLLVTHHPLLRQSPARLTEDDPDARRVTAAIRANLAVYCMHTNFDAAEGGVSDVLAQMLGLADVRVLATEERSCKIVVFVPPEQVDEVFRAMSKAGAGRIGEYRECSFRTRGTGTFEAPAGSHPAAGEPGSRNEVEEIRLETSVGKELLAAVVAALKSAHQYEEVAFDVYELAGGGRASTGFGRVGAVEPQALEAFAAQCARALRVSTLKWCGPPEGQVQTVAVCGGSGASLIDAAAAQGADVLVSGDIRYHDAQRALAVGLAVIDAGHDGTEAPAIGALAELVEERARSVGYTGRVVVDAQPGLWRPVGG